MASESFEIQGSAGVGERANRRNCPDDEVGFLRKRAGLEASLDAFALNRAPVNPAQETNGLVSMCVGLCV